MSVICIVDVCGVWGWSVGCAVGGVGEGAEGRGEGREWGGGGVGGGGRGGL